ncbi:MAG TPA: hypothetical protein VMY34_08935 [Acidimicrobiales bacterium]|nr:hypothetical protein [Acidimicrobiales bacterium]
METRRWINQSLPQTLSLATILLYLHGAFALLIFNDEVWYALALGTASPSLLNLVRLAVGGGSIAAGYLIANEKRNGWHLGIVMAALPLAARLLGSIRIQVSPIGTDFIGLIFDIALFVLIVHPMSREHQRVWFR